MLKLSIVAVVVLLMVSDITTQEIEISEQKGQPNQEEDKSLNREKFNDIKSDKKKKLEEILQFMKDYFNEDENEMKNNIGFNDYEDYLNNEHNIATDAIKTNGNAIDENYNNIILTKRNIVKPIHAKSRDQLKNVLNARRYYNKIGRKNLRGRFF